MQQDERDAPADKAKTGTQNPAPVSPIHFAEAMRTHWEALGNSSSDKLMQQWRGMGNAFSRAVLIGAGKHFDGQEHGQWQVLQPPTGTGKTQGACVYASLVAKQNRHLRPDFDETGILIVSPFVTDTEAIADAINRLAGFECALARHSGKRASRKEMAQRDVLVITHKAYISALEDDVLERGEDRLDHFLRWRCGPRLLTIIDESLSELVKSYSATAEDFRFVAGMIDRDLESRFPWAANQVCGDAHTIREIEILLSERNPEEIKRTSGIWTGASDDDLAWHANRSEFLRLRRDLVQRKYDQTLLGYEDNTARRTIAARVDRTLATMEAMRAGGGYRSGTAGKFTIHTSKLLIPDHLAGPVILDATAEQDPVWGLLGSCVNVLTRVEGVRTYQNVTLHVARAANVGQDSMRKNADARLSRLFANLNCSLAGRRVFLCLHKDIEAKALSYETTFADFSVDHWGHINGRNDWRDFDAAILLGLQYLPTTWAFDLVMATRSYRQSDGPLFDGDDEERRELSSTLQTCHMATSIVQAMNRIRCRKVIDGQGNCAPVDVFIILPSNKLGDDLLTRIKQEMPGIKTVQWDFSLDGEKLDVGKAHYAEPVYRYMKNCGPGETDLRDLVKELGLSKGAKKDLQADLRDDTHPLTRQLKAIGVTYHSTGRGPGSRSFLLKK